MSDYPETKFILTGIKEMIFRQIDISKDNRSVCDRSKMMDNINEDVLLKLVPNYKELEEQVAETLGEDFTARLLGLETSAPIYEPNVAPTLSVSDDQEITTNGTGLLECTIVGGNLDISDFTFHWFNNYGPDSATIVDDDAQNTTVTFIESGIYSINCDARSIKNQLIIRGSIRFTVTPSS